MRTGTGLGGDGGSRRGAERIASSGVVVLRPSIWRLESIPYFDMTATTWTSIYHHHLDETSCNPLARSFFIFPAAMLDRGGGYCLGRSVNRCEEALYPTFLAGLLACRSSADDGGVSHCPVLTDTREAECTTGRPEVRSTSNAPTEAARGDGGG